jgi:hypothetical protein
MIHSVVIMQLPIARASPAFQASFRLSLKSDETSFSQSFR